MRILGVSAYYHDSAAALIEDGRVVAAAQEERFTRRKHDASFPENAVTYCLSEGGVAISGLDAVVFYEKPFLKFERLLVTHVDYSARLQTVHVETNPRFHALLSRFKSRTGCPVLINTSFNVRGEPIVCTPEDAFRCFMGTDIELLVVGNCLLRKEDQNPALRMNGSDGFELD
jgi:predicted NodU family carbamoyl transferase